MIRPILFLLLFGLTLMAAAQSPVFVQAYDNEIFGNDLVLTRNGDLLIAGDKQYPGPRPVRNSSDFGLMRVDSAGHPLMTKVYHFLANDHLAYVKNAPGGYVWGGMSGKHRNHALLVITSTNSRGQVRWSKAFRPFHAGGVVLSGLDVNRQGEIVFSAFTRSRSSSNPTPVVLGILAKLDSTGTLLWTRQVALGDRFPLEAAPHSSVAFGAAGSILVGWHFGRATQPGSSGIAFQAYGPQGALRWSQSYRANALLAMTYAPADSGLAAYALDTAHRSGLIRLDKMGNLRYAFLDDLQQNTANTLRPNARIEAEGARIPYAVHQQLTLHTRPTASLGATMPAIAVERPALFTDFAVHGRHAYMIGSAFYPPTQKRYPVLLKSAFAQVDNCFTRTDSTRIRARFLLPPHQVTLMPLSTTAIALNDSSIRLRVRTLRTRDSLACLGDGEVWPGDANSDGIAEVKDLFAIGLAWRSQGPQRPNASLRWTGQPARNWRRDLPNGANFKHADCDGNGRVERADIRAIALNYNRVHRKTEANGQPGDTPLFAKLPGQLQAGTQVRVPIRLGEASRSADPLHGLSFSVNYDPALVGADLSFSPVASWLGTPGSDLEWIAIDFRLDGILEVGLTRTTGWDVQGEGVIGYLSFTLTSQPGQNQTLSLRLSNTSAVNHREEELPLYGQESTGLINRPAGELSPLGMQLEVYPNPTVEQVNIRSSESKLQVIEVLDILGNPVLQQQAYGLQTRINLRTLPEGVYFLRITTDAGVEMQQIQLIND